MKEKILVIEDNEPTRRLIAKILNFEDFDVSQAGDGREGIEIAKQFKPDLILCDIMMPVMDGFQVIRAFQHDTALAAIPFIFLTALAEVENVRKGMDEGADDYLTKPVNPENLLASVRKRLDKKNKMEAESRLLAEETGLRVAAIIPAEIQHSLQQINTLIGSLALKHAGAVPEILEVHQLVKSRCDYLSRLVRRVSLCHQLPQLYANRFTRTPDNHSSDTSATIKKICADITSRHDATRRTNLDIHVTRIPIPEDHLEILLSEILDNACKFSPKNSPIQVAATEAQGCCVLSITDEGPGMTAEQIAGISAFKQFWGGSDKPSGLGIGLTIAQGLVRLHNGEFEITHKNPTGLEVKCYIPMEA